MVTIPENEESALTFEDQLEALYPKLLTHAMILTRSKQNAEDLVQNTCLRALERLDQWQSIGRFDGWVSSIMENIWFNQLRQKRQRQEQELPEPDLVPERGFENQVQAKMVIDMLRANSIVSDEDFSLVFRIHVHGYTYRDLAEEYNVPLGTMLSRVSRIKVALRSTFAEPDQEGAG